MNDTEKRVVREIRKLLKDQDEYLRIGSASHEIVRVAAMKLCKELVAGKYENARNLVDTWVVITRPGTPHTGRIGRVYTDNGFGEDRMLGVQFGADGPFKRYRVSAFREATLDEIEKKTGVRSGRKADTKMPS